jgi:hypothetical protein
MINDTSFSNFISPMDFSIEAGSWALADGSGYIYRARTAADATFSAYIPIRVWGNAAYRKGSLLNSIDVWYRIVTADCDDFATVELFKEIMYIQDASPSGALVTTTCDALHDTAAKRKAIGIHKMTISLAIPTWIDKEDFYYLKLYVDCAATTSFRFYGARANFTLRA